MASAPLSPTLRVPEQHRILYHMGSEAWRDAVLLSWARSRASLSDPAWRKLLSLPGKWAIPAFPVSGRDLLEAGLPAGPGIGETLRRLEDWWVASDFKPDKMELLQRAR
jgi:poly(A) polymerase